MPKLRTALLSTTIVLFAHGAMAQNANVSTVPPAYTSGSKAQSMTPSGGLRTQPQDGAGHDVSVAHPLPVSGTLTPSGTGDVNLKQVNAAAVNVGVGAASTGTQRVTTSTDSTIGTVTNAVGIKGADGSAIASATNPVNIVQSPTTVAGLSTKSSAALESNDVIKNGAGNLVNLTTTVTTVSGYVMLFDAISAPADGAVTPVFCSPITSNATNGGIFISWPLPGKPFTTGITAVFSTTGCFSKTASATAAFFGDYK